MIAHQAGKFTLAILAAGMLLAQDGHEARGFGGGSRFDLQMPRSGGDFARQGPAYSGGLSSRATPATPRPESGQQWNRGYSAQPTEASRTATGQTGQTMSANQQNRQSAMGSTTSANQQQRQQYASSYQKQQENYASNAQESRQNYYANNDWDSYHYEGGGYAAGAVTGAAVTGAAVTSAAAATSLYRTTTAEVVPTGPVLPCTPPQVEQIQGVTYYRCGQSYFVVAYGNAGPTYMPASPPR